MGIGKHMAGPGGLAGDREPRQGIVLLMAVPGVWSPRAHVSWGPGKSGVVPWRVNGVFKEGEVLAAALGTKGPFVNL
jgi:hypothetical protein